MLITHQANVELMKEQIGTNQQEMEIRLENLASDANTAKSKAKELQEYIQVVEKEKANAFRQSERLNKDLTDLRNQQLTQLDEKEAEAHSFNQQMQQEKNKYRNEFE